MLGDSSRRGVVLSTTSTVVVIAVALAIFLLAPGSAQVRHTFFNPEDMWQSFVGDPKAGDDSVGEALWLNIRMFVAAEILILIFALVVAVIRQSTRPVLLPLRVAATIYVDVARGIPLILIIFAIGYGLPALGLTVISDQSAAVYWRGRAGHFLLGLRGRGVPGRDQLGAPQPGRGGPLARPDAVARRGT